MEKNSEEEKNTFSMNIRATKPSVKPSGDAMSGHVTAATRAETLQRITSRESCPCLMSCDSGITKSFFSTICNTPKYVKCHHLAKIMGELKSPLIWLQYLALEHHARARKSKDK